MMIRMPSFAKEHAASVACRSAPPEARSGTSSATGRGAPKQERTFGWSALHHAAAAGHACAVKVLSADSKAAMPGVGAACVRMCACVCARVCVCVCERACARSYIPPRVHA